MEQTTMKSVLLTGGSRGIGMAIANRYETAGYKVTMPTRKEMDLSSINSVQSYFEKKKTGFDVLINNAGENKISSICELTVEDWQRVLTVNLTAPFLLIQHVIPYMKENKWGRIVNISSCYSLVSRKQRAAYSASKAGLNSLTRTAAIEFAAYGILVNAICPGFVETDMTSQNNTPEQISELCSHIPLSRLGTPDEVADFVFYLGSEQNSYITGQALIVDGGFMSR